MITAKDVFHKISYLQYPVLAYSLYHYYLFFISLMEKEIEWGELNNVLVFVGISFSLSTLQDTTKTQNKISKKIWEHPVKGKIALIVISVLTVGFIVIGVVGLLGNKGRVYEEFSFGLIVLGIGLIGLLKAAIEMFENHRKDKNTKQSSES